MPAYFLMEIDWHDPAKATEYRNRLGPTLEKFAARTLVANEPHVLEGDWNPRRIVIIEFPSMESLKGWFGSPEYGPLSKIRKDGAKSRVIAVEPPAAP